MTPPRPAWRKAEPKAFHKVLIVGGGGHGLATAYHLAKDHGVTDVAVLERGWIGGGNTGRNTTIVRSNYRTEANGRLLDLSLKLWEGLSVDLDFNVMFSRRGVLFLAHDEAGREALIRRTNLIRFRGASSEWLERDAVRELVPNLDYTPAAPHPILGGHFQRSAGTARHDAVAWGYARRASALGVDIIENCRVEALRVEGGRVVGVETNRGFIGGERVGLAAVGHTSGLAATVGLRLPIECHTLQAAVSEPLAPCLDTVVISNSAHVYVSQSDKGELVLGGDLDHGNSFSRRGSPATVARFAAGLAELFPGWGRLRIMRTWGGAADMTTDGSAIIDRTPIPGLYLDAGWNYGGFKFTPASGFVFAHLLAHDRSHPLAERHSLNRFATGAVLDEDGTGPHPWLM